MIEADLLQFLMELCCYHTHFPHKPSGSMDVSVHERSVRMFWQIFLLDWSQFFKKHVQSGKIQAAEKTGQFVKSHRHDRSA